MGRIFTWGSYKIRCHDFAHIAHSMYPNHVEIQAIPAEMATGVYDATIVVKTVLKKRRTSYGKMFVDVVDQYDLTEDRIPNFYQVLVQNQFHAEMYPKHKTHVVTHWFNSYPADDSDEPLSPPLPVRPLPDGSIQPLRIATVWSPNPGLEDALPFTLDSSNFTSDSGYRFQMIQEAFNITSWYQRYINVTNETLLSIVQDDSLGTSYLYQEFFRQYDILVSFAKSGPKNRYNNMQRSISQMRSGTPVLLDCNGAAHADFCKLFRYPCTFVDVESFWSELERMKSPERRRECQQKGIEITSEWVVLRLLCAVCVLMCAFCMSVC
jgi:hypothetical protein